MQASCHGQSGSSVEVYETTFASRDGIGKVYMGREIAHVMGHLGANWLNRPERNQEENTKQVVRNLDLQPTDVIADIGAGSGYYTFRMAKKVPEGSVYAVDIQEEMIAIMRKKLKKQKAENIELVLGEPTDPQLPKNSVDIVFMVDVYHELEYPREMMLELIKALKPNGKVILVEYRMEDPTLMIKRLHKMSLEQATKEMEAVGLELIENIGHLPWQHFMVFGKK